MTDNKFMDKPLLNGDDIFWQGNQVGVLLIHGFTATTAEVRLMAEKLHSAGLTIAAPLLPGHGTHPDDLNRATWPMWLQKVKETYERLLRVCQKVFVLGTSMGALLSLELAAQHPEIPGLMLFSPALKVDSLWLAPLIAPFKAYLNKEPKDPNLAWKGYTVYPLKGAAQLYQLQKHVQEVLPKVHQPILICNGEKDETVSNEAVASMINRIKSAEIHLYLFHNSAHFVMLEDDLDKASEVVLNFIQNHASFG
jgi:carboxylesterase